jgi:hypothetical protein
MNLGCQSSLVLKKKHRERFNDIIIHDGSSFGLKSSLASEFPGRFTKTSPAAVELHCTFSLCGKTPHSIILALDKESEATYRPSPSVISGGSFAC